MNLYQQIAQRIHHHIRQGVYQPGERLPGVRRLSRQFGVSISTIVQAQQQLENNGFIAARPRSGYYVCPHLLEKPQPPAPSKPEQKPMPVTGQELALYLARVANQEDFIHLGAAVPHADFLPMRAMQRSLMKVARQYNNQAANYAFPPGLAALQQHIRRRMMLADTQVDEQDILITNGGHESLTLALRSVAKAGEIIAIESPTFYGLLQVIESLGMQALEIPTDPEQGMSLPALQMALEQWPIKACVLIPNFHNPLGYVMSDAHKALLVQLAQQHKLMLIEDDIYADLGHNGERPSTLYSFDQHGQVIYCSSFSKTVAQSLRLGWMVLPPAYFQKASYFKYVTNLAAPTLSQLALVDYLEYGGYERHLRQVQAQYAQQINRFTQFLSEALPAETRMTQPKGGFVLWVELPQTIDSLELTHRLLTHNISIAPGRLFSANQKYGHCIRLNCAQPWTVELEKALSLLCREIKKLLI